MKSIIISTLCIASAIGAISWYGLKHYPLMKPADHYSSLSEEEYAQGRLREKDAISRMTPRMTQELANKHLDLGAHVFIRIFKESREFEIWVQNLETQKSVSYTHLTLPTKA